MPQLSTGVANFQADTIGGIFGNAFLNIYAGTPPVDADTLLTLNELLVSHELSGFTVADNGIITAQSLPHVALIEATNTATFARLIAENSIIQLTLGVGTGEVQVDTVNYVQGEYSTLFSISITQEKM